MPDRHATPLDASNMVDPQPHPDPLMQVTAAPACRGSDVVWRRTMVSNTNLLALTSLLENANLPDMTGSSVRAYSLLRAAQSEAA